MNQILRGKPVLFPKAVSREGYRALSGYEGEGEGPASHPEFKRRLVSTLWKENGMYANCLLQIEFLFPTLGFIEYGSYSLGFDNV